MITTESSTTYLTFCIFILFGIGIAVCTWGRKIPGKGSWLVWTGILTLLTGIGLDSGILLQEAFKTKIWMSGWVGPRGEEGAITVGVFQDMLALMMCALTAVMAGAFTMNTGMLFKESSPERGFAAVAISLAGVALAWISLTPWLTFAGMIMTLLGGVIASGSRWDSSVEAQITARFIWERSSGFLLAFFGACILGTSHFPLLLNKADLLVTQESNVVSTWIGASLLVLGLFLQMQPFPFLGWIVSKSEVPHPFRTLLNQVFPAWAAFSLLLRLEPQFVSLGVFPGFGWVALASAVLIILSGLFQKHWRLGLSAWLAAGLSLSCALLAFSGPLPGLSMLIGVSLSALCLSSAGVALENECIHSVTNKKRAVWLKIASFLAAAGGTGVVGFVSSTGGVRWITQGMSIPGFAASFLFIFFLFIMLGWKELWQIVRLQAASEVSWVAVFSLFIWILLSLGIVWTGSATGDVLWGSPDRLVGSFFTEFFGTKALEFTNPDDFVSASSLYWGVLIFGFLSAYWMSGRKDDRWILMAGFMPKASRFFAQGYGVDSLVSRLGDGLSWCGKISERFIDQTVWTEWIPQSLFLVVKTVSEGASGIDTKLSSAVGGVLKRFVEVPAKILQLIQTGDLRWYLIFALGSGFALLSHFLKT